MPSTKVPVDHSGMYGGLNRAQQSYLSPPTSWFKQYGLRRGEDGLEQVPRKQGVLTVSNGYFDSSMPFGAFPPRVKKNTYHIHCKPTEEIKLKVKVSDTYSISCWSDDKTAFVPRFSVLDQDGLVVFRSVKMEDLYDHAHFFCVLDCFIEAGEYTILVASENGDSEGYATLVVMGGYEKQTSYGDSPVGELASCCPTGSDTVQFISGFGGTSQICNWNVYNATPRVSVTPFDPPYGRFLPILVEGTLSRVMCVWTDLNHIWLGEVGSTTNLWEFPAGFTPKGAVYSPTAEAIYFWDSPQRIIAKFSFGTETFTTYDISKDGLVVTGRLVHQNGKLWRLSNLGLMEVSEVNLAVGTMHSIDVIDWVYVAETAKYYGFFAGSQAKRYDSGIIEEIEFKCDPSIPVANGRRLLVSMKPTDTSVTFAGLMGVSYADEEVSELHMVNQRPAVEGYWADPVMVWVSPISRLCVLSAKGVGVQLELLA